MENDKDRPESSIADGEDSARPNDERSAGEYGQPVTIDAPSRAGGDTQRIEAFTCAFNGSIVNNGDSTFTYMPFAAFSGTDSFSYAIADGKGGIDTMVVRIHVAGGAVSSWAVAPTEGASSWRWSEWESEESGAQPAHRGGDAMPGTDRAVAAPDMLIGGASVDTFKFDDSGVLDLSLLAGRITGIDQFDIAATDNVELKLSFQDLLAMTESGHQLTILGDSGDKVSADFTGHSISVADMGSFTRYVVDGGAATLDIDNHVQRNIVGS